MRYFFKNTSLKIIGLPGNRLVMPDMEVEIDETIANLPAVNLYKCMNFASIRTEEDARPKAASKSAKVETAVEDEIAVEAPKAPKKRSTKKKTEAE